MCADRSRSKLISRIEWWVEKLSTTVTFFLAEKGQANEVTMPIHYLTNENGVSMLPIIDPTKYQDNSNNLLFDPELVKLKTSKNTLCQLFLYEWSRLPMLPENQQAERKMKLVARTKDLFIDNTTTVANYIRAYAAIRRYQWRNPFVDINIDVGCFDQVKQEIMKNPYLLDVLVLRVCQAKGDMTRTIVRTHAEEVWKRSPIIQDVKDIRLQADGAISYRILRKAPNTPNVSEQALVEFSHDELYRIPNNRALMDDYNKNWWRENVDFIVFRQYNEPMIVFKNSSRPPQPVKSQTIERLGRGDQLWLQPSNQMESLLAEIERLKAENERHAKIAADVEILKSVNQRLQEENKRLRARTSTSEDDSDEESDASVKRRRNY